MTALTSYQHALDRLFARLRPVQPRALAPASALGCRVAQDVVIKQAIPARAIALRDGYALRADEIAGASSYAPVVLTSAPSFIAAGDAVPVDCDCLVEASGLDLEGPLPQALVESFPGENLRRAGEDLASGALILRAGDRLSALVLPALQAAGLGHVIVHAPVLALHGAESPAKAMIAGLMAQDSVAQQGAPDLIVNFGDPQGEIFAAQLALEPGRDITLSIYEGVPMISLPPRADLAVAAWVAFILPALDQLSGHQRVRLRLPLAQKIASRVGIAEMVALRVQEGRFVPLALGDLPLQSLLCATHVAFIAATSEGVGAGDELEALAVRA